MRKKTAALYDPYLDTLGGGEKHILSIFKVLQENGYDLTIFWDEDIQKKIEDRFKLHLDRLTFQPNIFRYKNPVGKLLRLRSYDLLFYVPDGSYFYSTARKNYVFCMVPDKKLYPQSFLQKFKTLKSIFISNSHFTQHWLNQWSIKSEVIYPFVVEKTAKNSNFIQKDKIILSVGRFFKQLHSKRQSNLINLFNELNRKNPLFKDFKLILVGGLKEEDKDYFNELQHMSRTNPNILLTANISYQKLHELYKKSFFYVHMTGFGTDENTHPEQTEHLGITPLEAMSYGCVTFCYNAGGPKEFIQDGSNGFLFNSESELTKKMSIVLEDLSLQRAIAKNAIQFVTEHFSYEIFKKKVEEAIL